MNLIEEHNRRYQFFRDITGEAMRVYNKYRPGLMESAYEAALKYLLEQRGMKVERQVYLPIFWDEVQLDQSYRLDLVVNGVICELKAVAFISNEHRKQLKNYMNLTHQEYGMLMNFGAKDRFYSEWYRRDPRTGEIEQVRLM